MHFFHTLKVTAVLLTVPVALLHATPFPDGTAAAPTTSAWDPDVVFAPGAPHPKGAELGKCVDAAAQKLGLSPDMKTDPALLKDILTNVMHLDGMPEIEKALEQDLKTPQPLAEMYRLVRQGMTQNHPAVGVLVCRSLEDPTTKVVYEHANPAVTKKSAHHMYLLNKILGLCAGSSAMVDKVKEHLDKKIAEMVGGSSRWQRIWNVFKAAGLFGVVKDYSVELAIDGMKEMREQGVSGPDRVKTWANGLSINILEATATDWAHGYADNVAVGKAIAADKAQTIEVTNTKKALRYGLTMDFARLYETWNLAFITGNLEFLDILYPKLLAPRVILADGKAYMYERVIALWLSIQWYLMADLKQVPHIKFDGQVELAKLWGKVNLSYLKYVEAKRAAEKKTQ